MEVDVTLWSSIAIDFLNACWQAPIGWVYGYIPLGRSVLALHNDLTVVCRCFSEVL
jgi:hypothetical protein